MSKYTMEIHNRRSELKTLENKNHRDRMKMSTEFSKKMDALINRTPTGELRNELTDLNILYHSICETII